MNCKQVREHLLDGAQGARPAVWPEVEEHLAACATCADEWEGLCRTMALLDEWQAPEPSPYFDSRLRSRLREERERPRGWLEWLRKPVVALALALLLAVGVSLFQSTPSGNGKKAPNAAQQQAATVQPGSAVADLQALDKDEELYANFELLDELAPQDAQEATP